jgi:hypothetical protein
VTTLASLLKQALDQVGGSHTALGQALGLSRPRVSRLFSEGERGYPLGVKACFKLAAFVNEEDTTVLRLAGKGWLADVLDQRESRSVVDRLTQEQRSLIGNYEIVKVRSPKMAKRLRALLDEMATEARGRPVVPAKPVQSTRRGAKPVQSARRGPRR